MIRLPTVVREVVVLFPTGTRNLFLVDSVQRSSGAHTMGNAGFFFSGVKRLKRETAHSPDRLPVQKRARLCLHVPYALWRAAV